MQRHCHEHHLRPQDRRCYQPWSKNVAPKNLCHILPERAGTVLRPAETPLTQRWEHTQTVPFLAQSNYTKRSTNNRQWQHLCEIGKNCKEPHLQSEKKETPPNDIFCKYLKNRAYITSNDNRFLLLASGFLANSLQNLNCSFQKRPQDSWRVKPRRAHGWLWALLGFFALSYLLGNLTTFICLLKEILDNITQISGSLRHVFYFTNIQARQT